jgi:hypothetical protein
MNAHDTADRAVTYLQAATVPGTEALMRYQLLARRDLLSKTAARARPQGRRRQGGAASEPLTVLERLELLALGEHLARHFRHPIQVHYALRAGATWPQIAAALGMTSFQARADYIQWAADQRRITEANPGMTTGISEAEHITALALAYAPACPSCGSHDIAWDGNDDTTESWHCCACGHVYITGGGS